LEKEVGEITDETKKKALAHLHGQFWPERARTREANKENISLRVGERSETIIILLTGSIPKRKRDCLVGNLNVGRVVVEHSGNVLLHHLKQ
jgi:hypothetical protein